MMEGAVSTALSSVPQQEEGLPQLPLPYRYILRVQSFDESPDVNAVGVAIVSDPNLTDTMIVLLGWWSLVCAMSPLFPACACLCFSFGSKGALSATG